MNTIVTIRDPQTNDILQEWVDVESEKCDGIRGRQPINEACGGCIGCMEAQAQHWGMRVERTRLSFKNFVGLHG